MGGEYYTSGPLDELTGGHKTKSANTKYHHKEESITRVRDVSDCSSNTVVFIYDFLR